MISLLSNGLSRVFPSTTIQKHQFFGAQLSLLSNSCDSMNCSLPGFSVHGISQARILEWVAISFSNARMHAKSLQSCPTLCNPMDSSPPGSSAHRILQTRALEWVARSFSDTAVKNQEIISDPEIPTGSRVMRMFLHHRPHFEEEEFPLRGRLDNFILISHGRNEEIPIL